LGQLGIGHTDDIGNAAGQVASLADVDLGPGSTAVQLALGSSHTCAVLNDGQLYAPRPLPIPWFGRFILWRERARGARVRVGSASAALSSRAPPDPLIPVSSKCWGRNDYGQLGLGNVKYSTAWGNGADEMGANLPSVDLGAGWTAVEVAAGLLHTCALLKNGAVRALKCWGSARRMSCMNCYASIGQLGLGDATDRGYGFSMGDKLPAVQLGTGLWAVALALGSFHSCALLNGGSVKCWGANEDGQLGLGHTDNIGARGGEMGDSLLAVDLGGTAVQLTAGDSHTCALLNDGYMCVPRPPPLPCMGCVSLA